MRAVESLVMQHRPSLVAIDSCKAISDAFDTDRERRAFAYDLGGTPAGPTTMVMDTTGTGKSRVSLSWLLHLWGLVDWLKSEGISLYITSEQPYTGMNVLHLGVSYLADNIVTIEYSQNSAAVERYMRVVKARGTAHDSAGRRFTISRERTHLSVAGTHGSTEPPV